MVTVFSMTVAVVGVVNRTGRWHSLELEASVRGRGVGVEACRAVGGHVQALLDLELAGDFLPKSLVPQGVQLWTSLAAVQGSLK